MTSGAVSSLGASASAGELVSSIEGAAAGWSSGTADKEENSIKKNNFTSKVFKNVRYLLEKELNNFHWSTAAVKAVYLEISNELFTYR